MNIIIMQQNMDITGMCVTPNTGRYIDGLVQDCSNSSALAMELLQSDTKSSISWHQFLV